MTIDRGTNQAFLFFGTSAMLSAFVQASELLHHQKQVGAPTDDNDYYSCLDEKSIVQAAVEMTYFCSNYTCR